VSTSLIGAPAGNALPFDLPIPSSRRWRRAFDPINGVNPGLGIVYWDHALGDNSTTQGPGNPNVAPFDPAGAAYGTAISDSNVAQNSWKAHWFFGPGFDPTIDATYDIFLAAFDPAGGPDPIAISSIQIIVGQGGAAAVPVPAPATLALIGLSLLGLAVPRRRRTK
jgi:hypothetical protein